MESWFVYAVLATLLYGALNFLFTMAAERGCDADGLVGAVGLSVAGLAFGTLLFTEAAPGTVFTRPVWIYAFFNGLFFALSTLAKVGALKRAPAATVFTLDRLNSLAVLAIGFLFFRETARPVQIAGIATGLGVLGLVTLDQRVHFTGAGSRARLAGILLALGSAAFTALTLTVGKLLAGSSANRIAYIGVSYALVFVFTSVRRRVVGAGPGPAPGAKAHRRALFGLAIGALNYAGYFLLLQAFGCGPLSLAQAVFSCSIIIPILLSRLFYGERMSAWQVAAIGLAILSVALIGMK